MHIFMRVITWNNSEAKQRVQTVIYYVNLVSYLCLPSLFFPLCFSSSIFLFYSHPWWSGYNLDISVSLLVRSLISPKDTLFLCPSFRALSGKKFPRAKISLHSTRRRFLVVIFVKCKNYISIE